MRSVITNEYIEKMTDILRNSFNRRVTMNRFMDKCRIPDGLEAKWRVSESKEQFLVRLFPILRKNREGQSAIIRMAYYLINLNTFPDLQGWDNSAKMIKIARDSVLKLKEYHKQQLEFLDRMEQIHKRQKEYEEKLKQLEENRQSLESFKDRLHDLSGRLGEDNAHYQFQKWFFDLMDFFNIANHRAYLYSSENDGWIKVDEIQYLISLKFSPGQASVLDIDHFYKNVTSQGINWMGLMISPAGYSRLAIEEASGVRTPLLLLDHNHIYLILNYLISPDNLVQKLRYLTKKSGDSYINPEKIIS